MALTKNKVGKDKTAFPQSVDAWAFGLVPKEVLLEADIGASCGMHVGVMLWFLPLFSPSLGGHLS